MHRACCAVLLLAAAASAAGYPADWRPLAAAVRAQIATGAVPGAVVIVGDAQQIRLREAWGVRSYGPRVERMTAETIFDLASLTKPLCTTTAVLRLADRGLLSLDEPVARRWPAFGTNGKQDITPRHLLSHSSGLRAGFTWGSGEAGSASGAKLAAERPRSPPGAQRLYSDLNFVALGLLVERVSGERLDRYCRRHVFEPLGMQDTRFLPSPRQLGRIAPTAPQGSGWLRGLVQDPTAARMGGVAGHAGLFGTADDLARFAQAMLLRAQGFPLSQQMIAQLQRPQGPTAQPTWQGLGWELAAPLVPGRESLPPFGTVTHTGYTGTALWIDFVQQRFVVLLTSRLHPDGAGDARPLRRQVAALVASLGEPLQAAALAPIDPAFAQQVAPAAPPAPRVQTGIDVLRMQDYAPLRGRKVGLVTHLAAIDGQGWRTLDRLRHAPGVQLVRVFSPEHGLYGDLEGRIASGVERFSGIGVQSLYGETRRPTGAMLEGLDTLVVDLQDAGTRYFTYISTLGETLRAAAGTRLRVVVLDRPNPIGADRVAGPMLDPQRLSFTGFAPMPVQHGMTMGEMARFLQARLRTEGLDVDLQVVPMQGYRRAMRFAQTGLDWVPPSPNLRRPSTALLYAGSAWVEGTNVSVGRGTAHPFEWIGAPWIEGGRLAAALQAQRLPGVEVQPVVFVPDAAPFRGRRCEGVALRITDAQAFDGPRLGAALLQALHQLWPGTFRIDPLVGMVGSAAALDAIVSGLPLDTLAAQWAGEAAGFRRQREAVLLYDN